MLAGAALTISRRWRTWLIRTGNRCQTAWERSSEACTQPRTCRPGSIFGSSKNGWRWSGSSPPP